MRSLRRPIACWVRAGCPEKLTPDETRILRDKVIGCDRLNGKFQLDDPNHIQIKGHYLSQRLNGTDQRSLCNIKDNKGDCICLNNGPGRICYGLGPGANYVVDNFCSRMVGYPGNIKGVPGNNSQTDPDQATFEKWCKASRSGTGRIEDGTGLYYAMNSGAAGEGCVGSSHKVTLDEFHRVVLDATESIMDEYCGRLCIAPLYYHLTRRRPFSRFIRLPLGSTLKHASRIRSFV